MAKLYFRYGVMGSSKTANALMVKYNYEEKGKFAWLIKPSIDTRDDELDSNGSRKTIVKSRIGLHAEADVVASDKSIIEAFKAKSTSTKIDAIIVDEVQFMTENQIDDLKMICEYGHIPIICYGLLTDFRTKLFPGSRRLIEVANEVERIRHICKCGDGAQVNARLDSFGNVVTEGAQVEIGGNERYEAMCWKCWNNHIGNNELEF